MPIVSAFPILWELRETSERGGVWIHEEWRGGACAWARRRRRRKTTGEGATPLRQHEPLGKCQVYVGLDAVRHRLCLESCSIHVRVSSAHSSSRPPRARGAFPCGRRRDGQAYTESARRSYRARARWFSYVPLLSTINPGGIFPVRRSSLPPPPGRCGTGPYRVSGDVPVRGSRCVTVRVPTLPRSCPGGRSGQGVARAILMRF